MKKHIKIFIFIFILLIIMSIFILSIKNNKINDNTEVARIPFTEEALAFTNNEDSFKDIITVRPLRKDVQMSYNSDNMVEIIEKKGYECIRHVNDNIIYALSISEEGGVMIDLFENTEKRIIKRIWYLSSMLYKADFDTIKKGSTIEEVMDIDPYKEPPLRSYTESKLITYHYTMDGYIIEYYYGKNKDISKGLKVKEIRITEPEDNLLYNSLLEKDKEDIINFFK